MLERLDAPFSDAEVASLNEYQSSGAFHPFTCPNRSDGFHHDNGVDLGCLTATNAGWVCRDCDYVQLWTHKFMADRSWEILTCE